ncbi:MAG: EpsG family protein [Bacteroidales bacterium]|nr:EpsG family protein [Bacteroidales bacterium]
MAVWQREKDLDITAKTILFLLSPFLAFLYSLRTIKTKSSYVVFFLFSVFFGLSFTVSNIRDEVNSGDGVSYRANFETYRYTSYYQYLDGLEGFLTFDDGQKDYYFDTVAFYVSRITGNYHVMFMVFAIIFAFFSLKTFKFLTSEDNFNTSISCFILAYLFMINQIFNINGMRMWTAAWIGVYSIFQIFKNGNKKYFFLALITPFFHGSFWVYIAVITLAYFLRKREKIWIVLFIFSFFISNISVELIRNVIDSLPPFLANMAKSYTNEDYIEMRASAGSGFYWVSVLFSFLVRVYMNLLVYLFIKNSNLVKSNSKTKSLYMFLLVWMTFVNFTMPVPSLGGRFMVLSYPIIAYIWLVNFKGKKYKYVLYSMPFVFLFSFYTQFLYYIHVLEPYFFFSSPFYLIYKYLIIA